MKCPAWNAEARVAKLAEAETLLLQGNERLQGSEIAERKYKRDALERLVRLYQAWDKPEKLSEWKQKLEAAKAGETKSSELEEEKDIH